MATAQELQQQQDALKQQIQDTNAVIAANTAQADALAAQARALPEGSAARADLMSQAGDLAIANSNLIQQNVNTNDQFTAQQQTLDATVNAPFADPAATPAPDPNTGGTAVNTTDGVTSSSTVDNTNPFATAGSPTNPDATAADTAAKYADPTNIGPDYTPQTSNGYDAAMGNDIYTGGGYDPNAPTSKPSSEPVSPVKAIPIYSGPKDGRARLRIPSSYLVGNATGPNGELVAAGGIVFPYTPTIGIEHTANYNAVNTIHSNYTQYFYKNSQVGEISLSARFSVQNETEAGIYLSVVHLLRALTKMQFGDDANAGSPPPVCRLMAYGDFMLDNVPVAVRSFRQDFPDNVDYISTTGLQGMYGLSYVPVLSTISLTLVPIWSRNEMLQASVKGWLSGEQRAQGFL